MAKRWTARRMRQLRLELELSQTDFGKVLGLGLRHVRRLEKGETPLGKLHQLALSQVASQEGIEV